MPSASLASLRASEAAGQTNEVSLPNSLCYAFTFASSTRLLTNFRLSTGPGTTQKPQKEQTNKEVSHKLQATQSGRIFCHPPNLTKAVPNDLFDYKIKPNPFSIVWIAESSLLSSILIN
jgi:hypothetical protein